MPHLLCLRKSQTYWVYAGYAYTVFASCAKEQDLILGSPVAEYLAIQALYRSKDWWPPKRKNWGRTACWWMASCCNSCLTTPSSYSNLTYTQIASHVQFFITPGYSTSGATANISCCTNYETRLSTHYCNAARTPAPHASVQKAKPAPKIQPSHLGELDHQHRKQNCKKMAQTVTANVCQQVMPLAPTLGTGVGITAITSP